MVQLNVSAYFSQSYVKKLHEELMKTLVPFRWYDRWKLINIFTSKTYNGSIQLIADGVDVSGALLANHPHLSAELLKPIFDYADTVLENTNAILPEPEQNQMQIETLRLAISNGDHEQGGDNWHIDAARYMTSLTNLMGAGTLRDAEGPKPIVQTRNLPAPEHIEEIPEMSGMVASSFIRYFLFPFKGAELLNHRAQGGVRLTIVIFFKPKGMIENARVVSPSLADMELHSPEAQAKRTSLIKKFFGL